jgi:hypothetical protein
MAPYRLSEPRFDEIVPRSLLHKAGFEYRRTGVRLTWFNYCKFMVQAGACTQDCDNCKATLQDAFEHVDPKTARRPEYVLIWRLRNARMKMIERHVADSKSRPLSDAGNCGEPHQSGLEALEAML